MEPLGLRGKEVVFSDGGGSNPEPRGCSIHSANPTWTTKYKTVASLSHNNFSESNCMKAVAASFFALDQTSAHKMGVTTVYLTLIL